ncbi:HAD-IIA family hydrolase [Nocardioides pacificus]
MSLLGSSAEALTVDYDLAMLDLDGVVYVGRDAVPGAAAHLERARAAGMRLAFITNNASRPPAAVATHLEELGIPAEAEDVVTSAQAAARVLVERFGSGARVLLVGGDGLGESLRAVGLEPVVSVSDEPDAVVTGFGPDVRWHQIMEAAVAIRGGLPWVASNTDLTFPTAAGLAPGHGVLVRMLQEFTQVSPVVAGKPQRPLLDETVRRLGAARPLMVGDRLDTDIEGATAAGIDSLLVLTGVTGLPELVAATPEVRPTYLSPGLEGLLETHPAPDVTPGEVRSQGWSARVEAGHLVVDGGGDRSAWWQTVAVAGWRHLDETGVVVDTSRLVPPATADEPSTDSLSA